jgi:hypothetical protein
MSSAMPGLGAHVGQALLTPIADLGCVASVVPVTSSTAICSRLSVHRRRTHPSRMGTKSRETIYGASVRAAAERATEALPRSEMPWLQHPPNRCPRHRAATEDNTGP